MTRRYVEFPVWAWFCDRCGSYGGEIGHEQRDLPSPDEMRARGWFIAEKWGDLCSRCAQTPPIERKP